MYILSTILTVTEKKTTIFGYITPVLLLDGASLLLSQRNLVRNNIDCPKDEIAYTCFTGSQSGAFVDQTWYISLNGTETTVTFDNDTSINTNISVARNVFVILEMFVDMNYAVSRFSMIPDVDVTLPPAVIQCGFNGGSNSSIIPIDVVNPRGGLIST
jgi:hypothetical protein